MIVAAIQALVTLVGVRGLVGFGVGIAVGFGPGYLAGKWGESHATDAKITAALAAAQREQERADDEALDAANWARRSSERDADTGGLLDDDGWRRP
ncbi:hypothetical protein [Acuticoccus kandeliae]|uniref:hypothetical protein n=1 Tax=Acuticoccus kandeliae TaxID=2073160 RepID=UPI000D3E9122|nr:hypothetical protein [Acuticoccus kandeliae]